MVKDHEPQNNLTITDTGGNCPNSSNASKKTVEVAKLILDAEAPLDHSVDASPWPDYISHRINLFDKLKKEYDDEVASKHRKTISVDLPDYARTIAETSWETTPVGIARYLGAQALVKIIAVARVDGELWDLDRPLENSCKLEFLKFDTPEGKNTFWKSSAHVLGQAAELGFGYLLCLSAVTKDSFFYEVGRTGSNGTNITIEAGDQKTLKEIAGQIIGAKQKFERLAVSKENLLEMFKYNKYKLHLISSNIADGASSTIYRCGPFIDLCVGPHMRDTGKIGVFEIEEKFPPGFLWHAEMDSVYRIYGISIPKKELLEDHNKIQLQDPELSLQGSVSGKAEFRAGRTDDEITNLEMLACVSQDRNSGGLVEFGFGPS